MAQISIIKKSELEGATRIDAEYYQPEYLKLENIINAFPNKTLAELAESVISFGAYALTNYIEWKDDGIPFIVAENIKKGFIDYSDVRFISDKTDELLSKSRVKENQVLLSMSGSVGNAAVANKIPKKLNSNQDIVKITVKKIFSPYVLAAFLNSYYGRNQILRVPVGSVQQHIFLWQIKNLKIPTIIFEKQKEIEETYVKGLDYLRDAQAFYSQAEELLLKELGIYNHDFKNDKPYCTVSASKAITENRLDAEYYQLKYSKLTDHLKNNFETKPLLELVENVPARFNPWQYENKHFRYVELSNINSSIGIIDGFTEIVGKDAPSRAKRLLKANDVIASSVEGSIDRVALVDKDHEDCPASTGFFQFRCQESILPEVILVLAGSVVLQMQLQKQTAGTILTAVPKEAIKKIILPIIPGNVQKQIADLVQKSHEARKEAKSLLSQTIQKVENMIEEN